MNKTAASYLTRRAMLEMRYIYKRSLNEWGEAVANRYLADLYSAMDKAAKNPESGILRQHRTTPFLMISARQHFIVYDRIPRGILILMILHQVRNIEAIVASLKPTFLQEVKNIKAENSNTLGKRRGGK